MRKTFFVLLGCVVLFTISCGKADCTSASVADEAQAVSVAGTTYITSPTKANCEAYKKALTAYFNEIDGCAAISSADIAAAKKSLDDLDCK
jgi:hypothetical protein